MHDEIQKNSGRVDPEANPAGMEGLYPSKVIKNLSPGSKKYRLPKKDIQSSSLACLHAQQKRYDSKDLINGNAEGGGTFSVLSDKVNPLNGKRDVKNFSISMLGVKNF